MRNSKFFWKSLSICWSFCNPRGAGKWITTPQFSLCVNGVGNSAVKAMIFLRTKYCKNLTHLQRVGTATIKDSSVESANVIVSETGNWA